MARQLFRLAPLLVSVLAVMLLVTGCMSQSPTARNTRPTPTLDMQSVCNELQGSQRDYCHKQIRLATLTPQSFGDRRAVRDYLQQDSEEATWAFEESVRQDEKDRHIDRATEGAMVETHEAMVARTGVADMATTEADYRNDAVRDCIGAGYNETLCLLDPENPTGD